MIEAGAVPDGGMWGNYPNMKADVGDSKATWTYNVYVHSFAPTALKGVILLAGEGVVGDDQGANFGSEMSVLVNCLKAKFGGDDLPVIYTVPSKALAPNITQPKGIKGKSTAIEIGDWTEVSKVIDSVLKVSK
jgi:hypothetical protein